MAFEIQKISPGGTRSSFNPPVFRGYWVEPDGETIIEDDIALLFTDIPTTVMDRVALENAVQGLKQSAFRAYEEFGSPQDDVWIVIESVEIES